MSCGRVQPLFPDGPRVAKIDSILTGCPVWPISTSLPTIHHSLHDHRDPLRRRAEVFPVEMGVAFGAGGVMVSEQLSGDAQALALHGRMAGVGMNCAGFAGGSNS